MDKRVGVLGGQEVLIRHLPTQIRLVKPVQDSSEAAKDFLYVLAARDWECDGLRIARQGREALIAGIKPEFDVSTQKGTKALAKQLEAMGLPATRIRDAIIILREQAELLGAVGVNTE